MGRQRSSKQSGRLPKYVYKGRVKYVYRAYAEGKRQKEIPLCPLTASTREIWEAYEELTQESFKKQDLYWLFEQYQSSDRFKSLSRHTIKEYTLCNKRILNKELDNNTTFGSVFVDDITPGTIRAYLDSRSESKVAANRETAYMGAAFSWAYERDLVSFNPVRGVKKYKETPRTLYVTDEMYQYFYNLAASPWYLRPMMEVAYLCRMRRSEVLSLTRADILPDGLNTRRTKGSNDTITNWSPRLRAAIDICLERKTRIQSLYLFTNQHGQPIKDGTFTTVWGKLWRDKADKSITRYTYHDLKAKGVSDFEGNKQDASGHKTASMVAVYDRKKKHVKATK